jgi:hypothetical protein
MRLEKVEIRGPEDLALVQPLGGDMRDYGYNSVQCSGVSAAAGLKSGQFDRKRNE